MVDEKKDQKIDYKSEPTNMYAISKEKNENLRKEISEMLTNKDKDRFTTYEYIIELIGHGHNTSTALHDLWAIPADVEDFSVDTFNKTFEILAEIINKLLDLGEILMKERKEELEDMPIMKVSQKVEDTNLGHMFG